MQRILQTIGGLLATLIVMSQPLSAQTLKQGAASAGGAQRPPVSGPVVGGPKAAAAKAAAPEVKPVDPAMVAKMEAILKAWEAKSTSVSKLDVEFSRVDEEKGWGKTNYVGHAVLQSPNLAWLDLGKIESDSEGKPVLDKDGKKKVMPHERIICTGKEVWQYSPPVKQIIIHPLAVEERQRALEEGPLPFLFNMKAAKAKERYKMSLVSETEEVYIIKINPLLAIDLDSFEFAYAQLDKKTLQPRQLRLVDKNRDTKDYWFTKMESNPATDFAKYFVGEKYVGWTVERNDAKSKQAPQNGQGTPSVGQLPQGKGREPIGLPKNRRQ